MAGNNPYYENEESGNTINWGRVLAIIGIILLILLLLVGAGWLLNNAGFFRSGETAWQSGNSSQFGANRDAMQTDQAQSAIGINVQRLSEEAGGFVWRSYGVGTANAVCPSGWRCTLHLANGNVQLFVGDNQSREIVAGTFRYVNAYPSNDDVYENPPCRLLFKEQENGRLDRPSFDVTAGNFSCNGGSANTNSGSSNTGTQNVSNTNQNGGSNSNVVCPDFGGRTMQSIENGTACLIDYNGQQVTGVIPDGWYAQTDTSGTVYAGQSVSFGSATFRRAA